MCIDCMMKDLHLDKQYILCGCCCVNMTVYLTCDHCLGISMSNECCCCLHECCFNDGHPMTCFDKEEGNIARIGCLCDALTFQNPKLCCKQSCHTCCLVTTASLPTSTESPFMLACLFCILYPSFGHCLTIEEVAANH